MNLPLGLRVALWTGIPLLLVTGVSGTLEYQRSRDELRAASAAMAEGYLAEFGRRVRADIARDDVERLEDDLHDLHALLPEMRRGEILVGGRSLASWEPIPIARDAPVGRSSTISRELSFEDGRHARIAITIDERRFARSLLERRDQILTETLCAAVVLLILCIGVGQALSRRIRHLATQSQRIARGNFSTTAVEGEDEIGQVGRAFNLMARELDEQRRTLAASRDEAMDAARTAREATTAKSHFLANMSHEIRTPLTAVLGFGENLLDPGLDARERDEATRAILRNGHHLLTLINDILDFSKIEAGRIELEVRPTSVARLLREVEQSIAGRARAKGLQFDVELPPRLPARIETDPTRLRQILLNLIGNAIKFTERGSITLIVHEAVPSGSDDGRIAFTVRDTGIGITAAARERLFRPFIQADATTTRKHGGTGLGLSISAELARLLGGTIQVDSIAGEGSSFRVTVATGSLAGVEWIEAGAPEAVPDPAEVEARPTARLPARVLVAEDGPDNQALFRHIFARAGADATIVENGRAAVDAYFAAEAEGNPYDLVVLDVQMPVLDGYDAARELRARGATLPIVAVTAHAMESDRRKCLEAGFSDYDTKPIDRARLLEKLSTQLASHDIERSVHG